MLPSSPIRPTGKFIMRRKPLSFMLLGVLACFSFTNTAFAQVIGAVKDCRSGAIGAAGIAGDCGANTSGIAHWEDRFNSGPKDCRCAQTTQDIVPRNYNYGAPNYFGEEGTQVAKKTRAGAVVYNRHPAHAPHKGQVKSLESPKYLMHRVRSQPQRNLRHHRTISHVGRFNRIVADGDINIVLKNSAAPRIVVLSRDCKCRRLIGCHVRNGTLYLNDLTKERCDPQVTCWRVFFDKIRWVGHHKFNGDSDIAAQKCKITTHPLQVLIDANGVESLELHEQSSIYAANYQSPRMAVRSFTSGSILLPGTRSVYDVQQYGCGYMVFDSINQSNVDITSEGPGLIKLGGRVDTLHVRAMCNAQIDAKFLRARDAWVESTGWSEAAVTAENALNGYATGFSYVYYYKTPSFFNALSYEHANVIQMAWWD